MHHLAHPRPAPPSPVLLGRATPLDTPRRVAYPCLIRFGWYNNWGQVTGTSCILSANAMRYRLIILIILVPIILGLGFFACATPPTPYQPESKGYGFRGGYSDQQLDADTFRVAFKGNEHTPASTVETYLLYRCAELAVEKGYDYFIIMDQKVVRKMGVYSYPGMVNTGPSKGYGGNVSPSGLKVYHLDRVEGMTIKAFKGTAPSDDPEAFTAREVMNDLSGQIQRP